ncbi:hypothetical protein MMC27_002677 [Xylographa pallens]|nr:hypothetical protein [Xylographa pallens]
MALEDEAVTGTGLTADAVIRSAGENGVNGDEKDNYLKGIRLHLLTLALAHNLGKD